MSRRLDNGNPMVSIGLVATSIYVLLSLFIAAAAHIAYSTQCGGTAAWDISPVVLPGLVSGRIEWILPTQDTCRIGTGQVWLMVAPVLVFMVVAALAAVFGWHVWRQSGAWLRQDILSRDGVARRAEISREFGAKAALKRGRYTHPAAKDPKVEEVSWTIGKSRGITVHVSTEESLVIQGAPRSGKGLYVIINAILDAPGAVVTTSTRADNLVVTMKARATNGRPVTVFDPQGMSGLPTTLRWSPVRGCEDPDVATRRALVISADAALKGENAAWQKRSQIVLQCLLHAAALSGEGVSSFRRWASNPVLAREAINVLGQPEAALGWQADLMGIIDDDPRNTSNSWIGVTAAAAPLSSPKVLAALNPQGSGEQFDPKAFIEQRGTLYLIGTKSGAAAAGPYLSALIDDIDYAAREMAFVCAGGRLDPPLSLILDEIANLSPWPGLPVALSDGGGIGISTIVVLQSLSQARSGWSMDEAATIWDAAIIKVIFGGGSDERDLRALAGLIGERTLTLNTRSWSAQGRQDGEQIRESPVIPLHEIRRLPVGTAIMLGRRSRPILLDLREWHKRKDAAQLGRSKVQTELELLTGHLNRQRDQHLSTTIENQES